MSIRDGLLAKYRSLRRGDEVMWIFLPPNKFCDLMDETPALERFTYEPAMKAGYDSLILDFPLNTLVAVLAMQQIGATPTVVFMDEFRAIKGA